MDFAPQEPHHNEEPSQFVAPEQKQEEPAEKKEVLSIPEKQGPSPWPKRFLAWSIFLLLVAGVSYFTVFDAQNRVLGLVGVSNVGGELENLRQKKVNFEAEIAKISNETSEVKQNSALQAVIDITEDLQQERIAWSKMLQEIEVAVASVPQDFLDDIIFRQFAANAKDKRFGIIAAMKNEKVFTLMANLVDVLEDHKDFHNVDFQEFSKEKFEDGDPDIHEYTSDVKVFFQFSS